LSDRVALHDVSLSGNLPRKENEMDAETHHIHDLIASLSDAYWHRLTMPGISPLDALCVDEYRPESDEEKAIWKEITAPHNHDALLRYITDRRLYGLTEYSARLYESLLAEATRRRQEREAEV
jgi:hypothetical protein